MVEEYQQAVSVANLGGTRDVQGLYLQLGLKNSPQVLSSCTSNLNYRSDLFNFIGIFLFSSDFFHL